MTTNQTDLTWGESPQELKIGTVKVRWTQPAVNFSDHIYSGDAIGLCDGIQFRLLVLQQCYIFLLWKEKKKSLLDDWKAEGVRPVFVKLHLSCYITTTEVQHGQSLAEWLSSLFTQNIKLYDFLLPREFARPGHLIHNSWYSHAQSQHIT